MSFGQPRPSAKKLLVSMQGCANNISIEKNGDSFSYNDSNIDITYLTTMPSLNSVPTHNEESYFYLYRISYTWYAFIGFAITLTIGVLASYISEKLCYSGKNDEKIKPDLFIEPIRRRMLAKYSVKS